MDSAPHFNLKFRRAVFVSALSDFSSSYNSTITTMAVRSTHATGDSFTPVAIIGVGLRAPGNISDLESLWDTLVHGKSHHARMASDPRFLKRFDPNDDGFRAMFDVTPDARDTLHGNLLDETPGLDRSFFGISERESMCMDVQQKLLLHVAHEALEDAGYNGGVDGTFDKSTFGVYVASATDDFEMVCKLRNMARCR